MDPLTEEELFKQKRLLEDLQRPKYNPRPVAEWVCRQTGTRSLLQLASRPNGVFGARPDAWSLMVDRTIGVEVGSVKREGGVPNQEFTFHLEDDASKREQQCVSCVLSPQNAETCRFLDDPRIPQRECWVNPGTDAPVPGDLARACIYSCTIRHRWSNFPINVDARLNFYHKGVNAIQHLEAHDRLYERAGATKGAFTSIAQTPKEGEDVNNVPIPALQFGPTHPAFVRTMALVNESNLMNGIIEIPFDVCVEAQLPVYRGVPEMNERTLESLLEQMTLENDDEKAEARQKVIDAAQRGFQESTKDKEQIKSFFAVPVMHVLAWPLHSEAFSQQHDIQVEMLRFKPPPKGDGSEADPVVLYYLVSDVFFRGMVEGFTDAELGWMDKVDMRPLNRVGFDLVPYTDRNHYASTIPKDVRSVKGVIALRAYLKYMVPPVGLTREAIASLAPTLAPGFTGSAEYVSEEEQKQLAIDRFMNKRDEPRGSKPF